MTYRFAAETKPNHKIGGASPPHRQLGENQTTGA